MTADPRQEQKRAAADLAVSRLESGMIVGLGTGSTASLAVQAIGRRQREEGLRIVGIPTSEATADLARSLDIPLGDVATHPAIDLTIDGTDAVERKNLSLIKGLGGALLREKIVASISRRMIVITDGSKLDGAFGARVPVPVEVAQFGWQATERKLVALGCATTLRTNANGAPFVTDGGNYILDCAFGAISDATALEESLSRLVGVVETGLFIGYATEIIVASEAGIEILTL